VQRNAMRAWRGDGTFRENLKADADIRSKLSEDTITALFDLQHALRHVPTIVERALSR
jgi:adenylosuccinate lyase